ncbi:hypothetical protein N2152v2_008398 [Parachlorella kessleri]
MPLINAQAGGFRRWLRVKAREWQLGDGMASAPASEAARLPPLPRHPAQEKPAKKADRFAALSERYVKQGKQPNRTSAGGASGSIRPLEAIFRVDYLEGKPDCFKAGPEDSVLATFSHGDGMFPGQL